MKVTKLLHTRYRLNDLERSVKFYREVLGLEEVRRHKSPRGSELVFLKAPQSEETIELCHFPSSGPVEVQPDLTHLAFEVESLAGFAQHLERLGLKYSDGPHYKPDGSGGFAFVDAPEGYEVELIQRSPAANSRSVLISGMEWRCARFRFDFPRPALVMGVINVTPDSFSDGGRYLDPAVAVDRALALAAEGADLLDIGGESTRPGAAPVSEAEELDRVLPVLQRLATQVTIPLSIDTQKPVVARAAINAGASIINDIAANRKEPTMGDLVAKTGVGYVAMHMQGTPATMQTAPEYQDVRTEVKAFFGERLGRLAGAGVAPEQVVLDPGIGFGKSLTHTMDLLAGLSELRRIGRPLLLGISRKSFIGKLLGVGVQDRLAAGLACTVWAALQGAQIFRTHDVAATVQALRMTEALREPRPVLP